MLGLGQVAPSAAVAASEFSWWTILIGLLGGLALFLYGIEKMSDGLRAVAGERMKDLLGRLTANRFIGIVTGAAVTAIVQSSSLTTVLIVGFVSAGLMTLQQSVGVIMGANIGSTLTVQIVAFKVTQSAWLLIALGFAGIALYRRDFTRQWGSVLIGLGLLFLALDQMSNATSPLRSYGPFLSLMLRLEHPFLGIMAGAIVTAIVQSSAATTGIVLALASQNVMTLPAALAVALGANLGSCATAWLASLGKPPEAKQAALVHLMFNVIGVLSWSFLIPQLAAVVVQLSDDLPRQIAHAHTLFNVANTAVLIWFSGPLARLACYLIPSQPLPPSPIAAGKARYLDSAMLSTPALALDRIRLEVTHLGENVLRMMERCKLAVLEGTREELLEIARSDQEVNQLYVAIVDYVRQLARHELSHSETEALEDCLAVANDLENAGDVIANNLVLPGLKRLELQLTISAPTKQMLRRLFQFVSESFHNAIQTFKEDDEELAAKVVAGKDEFNRLSRSVLFQLRRRLMADEPSRTATFQMEVDLVAQCQRLHYHARRIARLFLPKRKQKPIEPTASAEIGTNQAG